MNESIIGFIKEVFQSTSPIPLHAPVFLGNEKKYLGECIDSTFVSYVGPFVTKFEEATAKYTGARHAIALVNGTTALHLALMVAGVKSQDEVITQALTFVATVSAIKYCDAHPIFVDSERATLGMSIPVLEEFLEKETFQGEDGFCYNRKTKRKIAACVPVHIFGHPCRIDKIQALCTKKNIALIEDAAESLGSSYKGKHTGTFGDIGILSFNGNKTITTGGGGMILTDNEELAKKARYLSTTAKRPHRWEFFHDEVGYNYRMPNINAAVGYAQMEKIDFILSNKRELANIYRNFFHKKDVPFIDEPIDSTSNFWLNAISLSDRAARDSFLEASNNAGVMTRPVWTLLSKLPPYKSCQTTSLAEAQWLEDRLVNIPSSVRV